MNTVTVTKKDETPHCFGKDWDNTAPECAGGPDPSYTHPKTGQHLREQCNFFSSCGTRVAASRVIPADRLIRPPLVTPPPQTHTAPQNPPTFHDFLRTESAQAIERQRLQAMGIRPGVPAAASQGPYYQPPMQYPAPTYQLNYQMPAYLSVPEVRQPGEGLAPVLFREVFRSAGKAIGHAFSHFFDTRVMKEK